jgi:hypothetical protein
MNSRSTTPRGSLLRARASRIYRRLAGRGRPADVVVSFPKSGRNWLRVMLHELGVAPAFSHAGSEHVHRRTAEEIAPGTPAPERRILFLHRDPIDTAVSGYHQATKRVGNFEGSISEFIRDPRHGLEKTILFNRMWIERLRDRPNSFLLSYEELTRDPVRELTSAALFFGARPAPAEIARVVEENRFERMQARERSGELSRIHGSVLAPKDPEDPDSFKVRRGRIGGYADELSEADVAWARETVRRLGREDAPAGRPGGRPGA